MIAIIDGVGANINSVKYAISRISKDYYLTTDSEVIKNAACVILPGVGSSQQGMSALQNLNLDKLIPSLTQPVLGICLGMQLLCAYSEEDDIKCLDVIPTNIKRFPELEDLIIPHMTWNKIHFTDDNNFLFKELNSDDFAYFVHSYYAPISKFTLAKTNYGIEFSSIIKHKNFYGMQFHPERSGTVGEQLLKNFIGAACK